MPNSESPEPHEFTISFISLCDDQAECVLPEEAVDAANAPSEYSQTFGKIYNKESEEETQDV